MGKKHEETGKEIGAVLRLLIANLGGMAISYVAADQLMRVVSSSLKSMGIAAVRPAASRWRGRVAADGGGTASTSEGAIHASIRVVEAADHGGFWQIMGISASSPIDAVGLRERLEQAVQIDGKP